MLELSSEVRSPPRAVYPTWSFCFPARFLIFFLCLFLFGVLAFGLVLDILLVCVFFLLFF